MRKIGILTGGGDAPGLNAVIRAVVIRLAKEKEPFQCIGLVDGWAGLRDMNTVTLDTAEVDVILHQGGTILGTSRTNLYQNPDQAH